MPVAEVKDDLDIEDAASTQASTPSEQGFKLTKHEETLRWKNHTASLCLYLLANFTFGASPLVDRMNAESSEKWLALGITTFALNVFCALMVIMPLVGSVLKLLKYNGVYIWFVFITGLLLPLSIGVGASTNQLWLPYVGAILSSPGLVVSWEVGKVMVTQWWALDGKQRPGTAFFGLTTGLALLLITLSLGYTCQYWGLALAAYSHALLLALVSVWPLYLALRGELGPPPADLVARAERMTNTKGATALTGKRSDCETKLPVLSLCQICFHLLAVSLASFGMKMLLTSIFQSSYSVSFLTSTNMAALSLVLYALSRCLFAYFARPGCVMPILIALMATNAALYGCYPIIVERLPIWYLTVAKTVAGGGFAGIISIQTLLLLEVVPSHDLSAAFVVTEPFFGAGICFGPVIGYYLQLIEREKGVAAQRAYNLFFYASAAIYVTAVVNMAVLYIRLRTRRP